MSDSKRYYWLKLKRDFFKRHDIQIIEAMPNGKDYILFYLKLLCESVDHDGSLRFNDQIPYSPEMLATITNTNIDVVNSAIQIFTGLHMMELLDDGTFFMNEVSKMLGSAADNDSANRVRRFREKQKESEGDTPVLQNVTDCVTKCNGEALQNVTDCVTKCNESKRKSKSYSQNTKETKAKKSTFVPPAVEDVAAYCSERGNGIDAEEFVAYYASKGWTVGKNSPMKDWKSAVITWERNRKNKPKKGPNGVELTDDYNGDLDDLF